MWVVGIILIVVGIGLMFGHFAKSKGADELRGVERRQAGDLTRLIEEIGEELGVDGAYRERVELVGQAECDEPLVSPLGERPCLHYSMRVEREYEETYYDRDSSGEQRRRTRRGRDTVSNESESATFRVRDDSGAITVYAEGARFDGLVESVDRFDRGDPGELSVGRFVLSLASQLAGSRRTLGYRYKEQVFPVDRPVTVIGQVSDEMGQVALRKGDGKLMISTRTREQMIGSAKKAAKLLFVFGAIALGGGVVLVIAGLI